MKRIAVWALAALMGTMALAQSGGPPSLSGRRAPSFALQDSSLQWHDILDYRGKWLLLTFVFTGQIDCVSCPSVLKHLDAAVARQGSKVATLAITQSAKDNVDSVKAFRAANKTQTPILFDNNLVGIAYFKLTPAQSRMDPGHVFAINPQGMIVKDWTSAQASSPSFDAELDRVIAGGAGGGKK
jgi:peroxiredoxin